MNNCKTKILLLLPAILLIISSCTSGKKLDYNDADAVFKEAKSKFDSEDYIEASKLFDIIKLQFPASPYADDAQFHIAEIDFKNERFIYAAFNYNLVRKYYPNSEYAKLSLYKAALSQYKQSPKYDRDQEYTRKALNAMMEFQTIYPKDSLSTEAGKYIQDLRTKLAEREFATAELYKKMNYNSSALLYYDIVITDYDDTKFYEPAYLGKIEILIATKKFEEALGLCDLYPKTFPNGPNKSQVENLKEIAKSQKIK